MTDKVRVEEIKLRVVTPLFMGGVRTEKVPDKKGKKEEKIEVTEFRPPSLKGALRFWFRASNPARLQEEAHIFGSTEVGQASFLIQPLNLPATSGESFRWGQGLAYLGRGLADKGNLYRKYINPSEEIVFRLVFKPHSGVEIHRDVMDSIRCLCLLGGLGSRSRRGFGSVVIPNELPKDVAELSNQIKKVCQWDSIPQEVSYTAFSRKMRVVIPFVHNTWQAGLEKIGSELQSFRSFRTPPYKRPRFPKDRDLIYNAITGKPPKCAPERVAFGLPHNYHFPSLRGASACIEGTNEKRSRRASPLLIHLHLLANGQYATVVSFLPAPLLPNGDGLTIKTQGGYDGREFRVPVPQGYEAIERFLDDLTQLPEAVEVKF